MVSTAAKGLISEVQAYLERYVTFSDPMYALAAALWAVGTYFWQHLDVFPYLVITADTKRSGKTRLMEVLEFVCANPRRMNGMTGPTVYRALAGDNRPSMFTDESESLSAEVANLLRIVLNGGHRKGATIPRTVKNEIVDYPCYNPKCFVLIGDVNDTLRDRSVVVRMRQVNNPAKVRERFVYDLTKAEGNAIGAKVRELEQNVAAELKQVYQEHGPLPYLTSDRDEEAWLSLLSICEVVEPARVKELPRIAVDLSTEKTAPKREYSELLAVAEKDAQQVEYGIRLLQDLRVVIDGKKSAFTRDLLPALLAMELSPWRKIGGSGLDENKLAAMLETFDVRPTTVRQGKTVAKGYKKEDVTRALKANGAQ